MEYFKYISDPSVLASVLNGEMRFTVPAELNDPSELFPKFSREEVLESLRELRCRGHTQNELIGLKRQHALMRALIPSYWTAELPLTTADADLMIRLPIFDNVELIERLFIGMLDAMSSAIAVACLSKRWNSLPMWVHYANRARGAVVVYDDLERIFPGDATSWLNCPKDVAYTREMAGITFYPDSYGAIFFSKFRDWSYEEEIRIATELSRCTTSVYDGVAVHTRQVPVNYVSSVIMGWKMPQKSIDRTMQLLARDDRRHIRAESVRIHRGELARYPC